LALDEEEEGAGAVATDSGERLVTAEQRPGGPGGRGAPDLGHRRGARVWRIQVRPRRRLPLVTPMVRDALVRPERPRFRENERHACRFGGGSFDIVIGASFTGKRPAGSPDP